MIQIVPDEFRIPCERLLGSEYFEILGSRMIKSV